MGLISEFREFAMKGNLIDMAVGVVIGAAFGTVTSKFIDGVFMPIVGQVFQVGDFQNLAFSLGKTAEGKPNMIMIGSFISALINFMIIAFVMFMIIKGMNSMKKKEEAAPAAPPTPSNEEVLLSEIRDLLKK